MKIQRHSLVLRQMRTHKVVTGGILCVILIAGIILGWTVCVSILGWEQFGRVADQPFGDFVIQTQSPDTEIPLGNDMAMALFQTDVLKYDEMPYWFIPNYGELTTWLRSRPWFLDMSPRTFNMMDSGQFSVELQQEGYSVICSLMSVDIPSYLHFNELLRKHEDEFAGRSLDEGIILSTEVVHTIETLTGKTLVPGDILHISFARQMLDVPYLGAIPNSDMLWDFPRRWSNDGYLDCRNFLQFLDYFPVQGVASASDINSLSGLDLSNLSIAQSTSDKPDAHWQQLCVRIRPGADITAAMQETDEFLKTIDAWRDPDDENYTKAIPSDEVATAGFAYLNELIGGQMLIIGVCSLVAVLTILILGELQYLLYFKERGIYAVCRLLGCRRGWLARYILAQSALYLLPAGLIGFVIGSGAGVFETWTQIRMVLFSWWIPVVGVCTMLVLTLLIAALSSCMVTRVSPIEALTNGEVLG